MRYTRTHPHTRIHARIHKDMNGGEDRKSIMLNENYKTLFIKQINLMHSHGSIIIVLSKHALKNSCCHFKIAHLYRRALFIHSFIRSFCMFFFHLGCNMCGFIPLWWLYLQRCSVVRREIVIYLNINCVWGREWVREEKKIHREMK